MKKRLTIMVDADVYDGLLKMVGRPRISKFLNDLVRPHVVGELAAGYAAMAADEEREAEANAWVEGLISDVTDEPLHPSNLQ